jgi:hypothetical protein
LEIEHSTSHMLGKCSTTWAIPPVLLFLFVLGIGFP